MASNTGFINNLPKIYGMYTGGFVFFGQAAQLVGHLRPGFAECFGTGRVGLPGGLLQRRAHLFDFADACAHFNGQVDGEIPHVVGWEVAEHDDCCPYGCLGFSQGTVRTPRSVDQS